jgi:hypothetical protein
MRKAPGRVVYEDGEHPGRPRIIGTRHSQDNDRGFRFYVGRARNAGAIGSMSWSVRRLQEPVILRSRRTARSTRRR